MPWVPTAGHWYGMPEHFPADTTTVWCRSWAWYVSPFKAVWSTAAGEFTTVSGSQTMPWWAVARWMLV
jgi:hypothetical protein